MTNQEAAKTLRTAASEFLASGLKAFSDDKSMQQCYRSDGRDLRAIATLIRSGNIEQARRDINHLDTLVREVVPESVWNHCGCGW